jgi:hypothetical protein
MRVMKTACRLQRSGDRFSRNRPLRKRHGFRKWSGAYERTPTVYHKDIQWRASRYRVSHRTMSISLREPSHDPRMWAIFRTSSTSRQSYRKSLIENFHVSSRFAFYLIRRQTWPFLIVSRTNLGSTVLYLQMKGLSTHATHGDLGATLGPKAVASSQAGHRRSHSRP